MNFLRYRRELWKFQREKRSMCDSLRAKIELAKAQRDAEAEQLLVHELLQTEDHFEDEIAVLQTRRISTLADEHLIPIPEFNEKGA
jgi:hypothetical protein